MRPSWVYIRDATGRSGQKEAGLNGKTYSRRDEKRILDVLGRGLLEEFPNPERVGCPGADVLKRIARHEMPLSEAEKWLDHLGSCSPCYADFKRFQEAFERQRRQRWLAAAAGILLVVGIVGWTLLHNRNENLIAQTAVLDLRDRSISRGTEANPAEPPLEISRSVSRLKIYLPVGSSEGNYAIRISAAGEKIVVATEGAAIKQEGITSLALDVNLSSASPGLYVLQIQKVGSEWTSYRLRVK
jgi:hypothetical protein